MPLRLFLLRHAKSSWDEPVGDFDRSLAKKGRKAMTHVGALVQREGYLPALVLCSTAKRARETLDELRPYLAPDPEVTFTRRIYDAGAQNLLALIREADRSVPALMVIGHNPGLEDLAHILATTGDREARAHLHVKFPPAGLAVIDFEEATWRGIKPGNGRLVAFHTPDDD